MLGGQPGVWGRHYCPVLFMDSSVCVLRSLCLSLEWISYFQMRLSLLRVLSFLLPSFPALPTLKAGSNHRVAMSVVDRQAALGTRRQLWQYTAPPQLLWCGRVSQEVSVSGTDDVKVRRKQAVWGGCVPSTMVVPESAHVVRYEQQMQGFCSQCQGVRSVQRAVFFPTCSLAVWASARAYSGSGPGLQSAD